MDNPATLLGLHKEEYKIDGVRYTSIANFADNTLVIYSSQGKTINESLDTYTDFEGNMTDFIKACVQDGVE